MMNFDYKRINEYEQYWRKNHNIQDGQPSTIFKKPTNSIIGKSINIKLANGT